MERRRLVIAIAMGLVVISTLFAAAYLTFARSSSTGISALGAMGSSGNMNMNGATMSAATCDLVSPTKLDGLLHTVVQAPSAASSARETTCTYGIGADPAALVIRYTMGVSRARFDAASRTLAGAGRAPHHVDGLGDAACSTTVGPAGSTKTALMVLKGSDELLIVATIPVQTSQQIASAVLPAL